MLFLNCELCELQQSTGVIRILALDQRQLRVLLFTFAQAMTILVAMNAS